MTNKQLNWGIVGPGKIAHKFVQDVQRLPQHRVMAVSSRSQQRSDDFAATYNIPHAYDNHLDVLRDVDVDIVYIASPHPMHARLSIDALNHKKHVLCEKPLGVNTAEVKSMISAARDNNVFLMEALWSRFNPTINELYNRIKNGDIGEVNYINADFSFAADITNSTSRLINMDLAGGALLDVGIYPIFLSYIIKGIPTSIYAASQMHETGADLQTSAIFQYENGMAMIMGGFASTTDSPATIVGTKGRIEIDPRWHESIGYTLSQGNTKEHFSLPTTGNGFMPEIEECYRAISQGKIESECWSHQNSLDLIGIMDDIREQVGLRYPCE